LIDLASDGSNLSEQKRIMSSLRPDALDGTSHPSKHFKQKVQQLAADISRHRTQDFLRQYRFLTTITDAEAQMLVDKGVIDPKVEDEVIK
jgi:hypothetical protein